MTGFDFKKKAKQALNKIAKVNPLLEVKDEFFSSIADLECFKFERTDNPEGSGITVALSYDSSSDVGSAFFMLHQDGKDSTSMTEYFNSSMKDVDKRIQNAYAAAHNEMHRTEPDMQMEMVETELLSDKEMSDYATIFPALKSRHFSSDDGPAIFRITSLSTIHTDMGDYAVEPGEIVLVDYKSMSKYESVPVSVIKEFIAEMRKEGYSENDVVGKLAATFDWTREKAQAEYSANSSITSESDKLPGGLADDMPDEDFNEDQLGIGIEVEMEHTDDIELAKEIAKDHLMERPDDYYTELEKMENLPLPSESKAGPGELLRESDMRELGSKALESSEESNES